MESIQQRGSFTLADMAEQIDFADMAWVICLVSVLLIFFFLKFSMHSLVLANVKTPSTLARQGGFTLIELVVVIVILGILAATAIPRFSGMAQNARVATLNGMYGALQSASAVARAQAIVQARTAPAHTITMEGTAVILVNGYPSAATGGINNALSAATGFTFTTGATFDLASAPTPASCRITYASSAAADTPPVMTLITTGC